MVLSNTTLSSNQDEDGYCYWSSFDLTSFAKGSRKKAFVGQLNGSGPRCGDLAVIKIFVDKPGTESRCQTEMDKTSTAQNLTWSFLNKQPTRGERLEFVKLLKALMDDRSVVTPGSRKLQRGEWVLIEEKFDKHFRTFIDHCGRLKCKNVALLEAFVHFSYHYSGGRLVVCGLEGSKCGSCYRLKTPIIHSVDQSYGDSDAGKGGIDRVFGNHVCNDMCRGFISPEWSLDRPQPSAPYEPELQFLFDLEQFPYFVGQSGGPLYDNPPMVYDLDKGQKSLRLQPPPRLRYPELSPCTCQQCPCFECQTMFSVRSCPLASHRQA
ncbi:uncharacterized protein LOC121388775 [Gigantopelta aegis]|uniref:uncharacterized protein LOC121388775 n=1 Tax=Gigantopelta aegis TaxID=1735272 RepID=UPI001B889773|nr:uncharacterized protein LOC121388775 [Gigantopelta aegis]